MESIWTVPSSKIIELGKMNKTKLKEVMAKYVTLLYGVLSKDELIASIIDNAVRTNEVRW